MATPSVASPAAHRLCACGCGQAIQRLRHPYLRGHRPKTIIRACACGCGSCTRDIGRKWVRGHSPDPTDEQRFWQNVDKSSVHNGCWNWMGHKCRGYGKIRRGKKMVLSHRFSYELANGPIPDGLFVCHSCDNPSCVNPTHLWVGTAKDNVADMVAKGRASRICGDAHWSRRMPERRPTGDRCGARTHPEKVVRGEKHRSAKLTIELVREIRARYARGGVTCKQLAPEYGVTTCVIVTVISRKSWSHVL